MNILPLAHWDCKDCKHNLKENYFGEGFMVHDKLWDEHGVGENILCMDCFEKRLGRKLVARDFYDCHLNEVNEKIKTLKKESKLKKLPNKEFTWRR